MTSSIAQGVKSTQSNTRHIIAEMQNLRRDLISKPTVPTDPNFTLSRYLNSASTYAGSTLGSDDEEDLDGSSVIGTRYTQSVSAQTAIYEPEDQHSSGSSDEKFDSEASGQSTPVARPVKDGALPAFHWLPLLSKKREEHLEGQQGNPSRPAADVSSIPESSTRSRDEADRSDSSSSGSWETDAEDKSQAIELRSEQRSAPASRHRVRRREIYQVVKPQPTEPARVERITKEYEHMRQAEERTSRLRENKKGKENPCEAWNKMRKESRTGEKKQPSPSPLSPKPPTPQDDTAMRRKIYEEWNKASKEGKGFAQTEQASPYRFPGVKPITYDNAETSRRTYEVWQKMRRESAPKHTSSSPGGNESSDSPSIPNSRPETINRSPLQPSVQDTQDSSDENTPARGDIDQIPILIEVSVGTKHAPQNLEQQKVQPDADDMRDEEAMAKQRASSPILTASQAEASPGVDGKSNTGTGGQSPQKTEDAGTAQPDPSKLSIAEPATSIDYTNAPKIDPFIPTHPQNVFNDFFKNKEWKDPVEEEEIKDWGWDREGRRLTEVESGPYRGWHGYPPGSELSQPPKPRPADDKSPKPSPADDTSQPVTSKGIQFTDPLELFNNFMSDQMDVTDADDEEYWEPSTVRRPRIKQEVPLANMHPVKEWAHVPCSSGKIRNESAKAFKDGSRNEESGTEQQGGTGLQTSDPKDVFDQFVKAQSSKKTHRRRR